MSARFRLVTGEEKSSGALESFQSQYADWKDDQKFHDGTTKGAVLAAFNRLPHTPENVAAIINLSWAYPQCGFCDQHFNELVGISGDSASNEVLVCAACAGGVAMLLRRSNQKPVKAEEYHAAARQRKAFLRRYGKPHGN